MKPLQNQWNTMEIPIFRIDLIPRCFCRAPLVLVAWNTLGTCLKVLWCLLKLLSEDWSGFGQGWWAPVCHARRKSIHFHFWKSIGNYESLKIHNLLTWVYCKKIDTIMIVPVACTTRCHQARKLGFRSVMRIRGCKEEKGKARRRRSQPKGNSRWKGGNPGNENGSWQPPKAEDSERKTRE